jgi:hypothetical protein
MDITKEIWKRGKQEMEKLIKYVKETGLVAQNFLYFYTVTNYLPRYKNY